MYQILRARLNEKGITVYRLAQLTGIAAPDLYTALGGKKPLYPGWRRRIAEALEVPEEFLFSEDENQAKGGEDR